MGYAQSKLVGEHICANAAKQTGLTSRVLRIGQIIGDTKHGIWNPTEAFPLMLQSATTIGALPRLDESPRWMPVDTVAGVVVDISLADTPGFDSSMDPYPGVFNILNPHPFHWTNDLLPYLRNAGLEFEELGQREWVRRLRASNADPVANPPVKLVEFFASKYDSDLKPKRLEWDTEKARTVSSTFRGVGLVDQAIVEKSLAYFRGEGWVHRMH